MKKPLIVIALVAVLAIALAGCGGSSSSSAASSTASATASASSSASSASASSGASTSATAVSASAATDSALEQVFKDAAAALDQKAGDVAKELDDITEKSELKTCYEKALTDLEQLYNDGCAAIEVAGASSPSKDEYLDKLATEWTDCTDAVKMIYEEDLSYLR